MKTLLLLLALISSSIVSGQSYVVRDIKSFGAKGDGKTNDQAAFEKATQFFNERGGRGKLVISKGMYIIGKQEYSKGKAGKAVYQGFDVLHISGVKNLEIEGQKGAKMKFQDGLRYGAFDPKTGKPYEHGNSYFVQGEWAATIGHCIFIENSQEVLIKNIELDGNNGKVILGGIYGDVGRQLPHYGIFIKDSRNITVDGVNVHHFALDGISVSNKISSKEDDIELLNSAFEYNSRQGLSWIGGNELKVKGCKFNHTGQGRFYSPPGAGVDIEAEVGPIRNGRFENCEFINNKGCGLVADSGDSGFCEFKKCTFWGLDTWSIWITKPGFTFDNCNIYGSIVHGYNASSEKEATKFNECHFEDLPYKGKEAYGNFLVESNGIKRMSFAKCTFVSRRKKLIWVALGMGWKPEEKYQFSNCNFVIYNSNLPQGDFIAVMRGIRYKNCTFDFKDKEGKKKGYYLNDCCEPFNTDLGGNKIVYTN